MTKQYKIHLLFFLFCFSFIYSQSSYQSNKSQSACPNSLNQESLDINNVDALLFTGGDMFWNLFGDGKNHYEFPKGTHKNVVGPSALWIGGLDGGGQLKIAAQTYRQTGWDFWPGPLEMTASTDFYNCIRYDRFWKVDYKQITEFISNYKAGNVALNTYTPCESILSWPAVDSLIYDNTTSDYLKPAPYRDINFNGIYSPKNEGDYPQLKGDQQLFCIFNDKGDVHTETGGQSIGIEVRLTAYAYGCPSTIAQYPELANTTFYHYKIINKSPYNLNKTYVGFWSDIGIGDYKDDYIGSNQKEGYVYGYNATPFDSVYGNFIPATGTVLLKGPLADSNDLLDNNGDGNIDEAGEEITIPTITYFNTLFNNVGNPIPQMTRPTVASHYYNYMTGFWKDGSPFTCGGNGYGGTTQTNSIFTSSYTPIGPCGSNWTEISAGNPSGDRTYLLSAGTFTLEANSSIEFEIAFVTSMDSSATNSNLASVIKLEQDIQKIKNFYKLAVKPSCIDTNLIAKSIYPKKKEITFGPNPVEQEITINFEQYYSYVSTVKIYDLLGRVMFENKYINQEIAKIDLSHLSKAVYLIEISSGSFKLVKKLFKQ